MTRARIESIDLLRGLIIIVMALDHVRDFFGDAAANPTDLTTTTAALFFSRWITHFCAPAFFLLTGTGAYLSLSRMTPAELSRFLITRGIWLIVLELTVLRFTMQFNVDYQVTIVTVLWALGWAMIVLAGLVWLPLWLIAAAGAAMVLGHNLLDSIPAASFGPLAPLWTVLHAPGFLVHTERFSLFISYVLIPWVGVTALGFVLGSIFRLDPVRRQRLLLWWGMGAIAAFLLLRFANIYGDPVSWSDQSSPLRTLMSFLNVSKYPPSLLFLLATLGPLLLLLRAFDHHLPALARPALIIGKVPLFFFLGHFFLIHLLAVAASYLRYGEIGGMFRSPDMAHFPFSAPPNWGAGLPAIYAIWFGVVLIMFPLCRWYAGVKQRNDSWWLSYL